MCVNEPTDEKGGFLCLPVSPADPVYYLFPVLSLVMVLMFQGV
jgi:hypothetical protein